MDLYEALKSGTDVKTLTDAFNKELEAATAKITAEREAAQKAELAKKEKEASTKKAHEYLDSCRRDLAECLTDYLATLWEDDLDSLSDKDRRTIEEAIVKEILSYEKQLKASFSMAKEFLSRWNKLFESKSGDDSCWISVSKPTDADADIINNFLKNL